MDKIVYTPVIFRKWRRNGDIIALFPCIHYPAGNIQSYEHAGQHGEADYQTVMKKTTPADSREYKELAEELNKIGYENLFIYRRRQGWM